ncbi:Eco57I restriction-modification methylase domain-containing protein [Thermobifida halotolerans]|uniref:Eco57I restriction-modification methylase domain-containing protein n=1 Tax=Thermobifida halotolerans TaxID=483545 RepID=UPI0008380335|nr:DNA methyltransferase [Thermobifida halotolerans]
MSSPRSRRPRRSASDSAQQHREWLSLIEVSGPFLSLPVLRATWPNLESLTKDQVAALRRAHADWQAAPAAGQRPWIDFVLAGLLDWREEYRTGTEELAALAMAVPEHDTTVTPSFALVEPGEDVKPDTVRLLGLMCPPTTSPTARVKGEAWSATPVDRLAQLCRHHGVELGLATDGRWWVLVWAPRGGVTTTAVFDAVAWPEAAERVVVRAFSSLLGRERFFAVPDDELLVPLLRKSLDSQEDITEALGVQVRQAVELLVTAIGRADTWSREHGGSSGLAHVPAHEVYRGAVSVMMRVVFLLFAEERKLLPSDNELYARAYSAGRLCAELEQRALEGSEEELENTYTAWHRLLALFNAVYRGVEHPRLKMTAHDGSLFNPDQFGWLPLHIDDRTVLHMLRAVQYVEIGTGRSKERRALSFRALDVEQIGYVYEGLLSFDGFRADDVVVGLVGKEGREEEVALADLEALAAGHSDLDALAKALSDAYKQSGIGSTRAVAKRLAPLSGTDREEARKKLLAVPRGDYPLSERLLPFFGLLRTDLRGLPVVVLPGELYVTESPLRRNTGTHYTPRFLAEQVVEGALEPLVYEPGPLQTADRDEWKLKSSAEILGLKVADIAMGSAAFLVAAARYLGDRLVEAWVAEGDERVRDYTPTGDELGADEDPVTVEARRQIIEHCLYGVDINPMAVEMAKLSLWLVSMDPKRPFTFLDDRLAAGDSLLGVTSLEQVEYMHMDPKKGRKIHERALVDFTAGIRELVADVAQERRALTDIEGTSVAALNRKRSLLADAELRTGRVKLLADLCVGAALANAKKGDTGLRDGSLAAADLARRLNTAEPEARIKIREWLETDRPEGAFKRVPVHWPLVFPEVFEKGGFDAVIGNPPFLGGKKISGPMGSVYREYLVNCIAGDLKGHADLVAYFTLRAHGVLNNSGQTGLVATNTLAQGDTREVGLDQLTVNKVTIRQAVKSKPWPSKSAALEYCAVWGSRAGLGEKAKRVLDGNEVKGITSSLDPESRTSGHPERLAKNSGLAFNGQYIMGIGFTIEAKEAQKLIRKEARNSEILFPYLNGQDVNSRPDSSASRWVINFHDWPEGRASEYTDCFNHVVKQVKPDRLRQKDEHGKRYWWQFFRQRPKLRKAAYGLEQVVVITLVSKTVMPMMVPTGQVFAHKLGVFATDDTAMLALLSSAPHYWWVVAHGSTLETRINYSPSDVFETFPLPELTEELRELGSRLDTFRRDVMLSRQSGLTKTYNLVFDPDCTDDDIEELRRIHRAIDEATVRAYEWEDRIEAVGGLDHGFHPVGSKELRYTIGPAAQREILDSLLELNHERYAEEVAQGLHDKKKGKRASAETLFD